MGWWPRRGGRKGLGTGLAGSLLPRRFGCGGKVVGGSGKRNNIPTLV